MNPLLVTKNDSWQVLSAALPPLPSHQMNNVIINSTTNNSVTTFPSTFQIISFSWNIPFLLIFPILLLKCLILLLLERHSLPRNQKTLFSLLCLLCGLASFSVLTRVCSELSYFHPNRSEADKIYGVLKGIDRSSVGLVS